MNSITQSAVSQQIRALEERFGVVLIDRGKRNFALTPEGRAFLDASKEILETYHGLGDRLLEMKNIVAGDLRVASVYSIGLHELPFYLKRFQTRFPEVRILVEYRRSSVVYQEVAEGDADLGLVAYPKRRKGLTCETFWKDRLVLICPPTHPLAERSRVELADLQGENFIAFEPDLPTRKAIDRAFKESGMELKPCREFDNIETVKRSVEIENGISIVPWTTVRGEHRAGSLVAVEIIKPELWRPLGVVRRGRKHLPPPQKEFIRLLHEAPQWSKEEPGPSGARKTAA